MKPFLFVALDGLTKNEEATLSTARRLSDIDGDFGFKVNLDYLLWCGMSEAVHHIKQFGRPIFTDLKMWNGSRTMIDVVEGLIRLNVDFLNIYALADNLLLKTLEAVQILKAVRIANTKVLALTVLTHFNEDYCQRHFCRSLKETVRHFAEVAVGAGCHGIILPGTALDVVKDMSVIKVVPGVRPEWYKDTRHEEEVEPRVAVEGGADILVCGSPIMKAENPAAALKKVLSEIKEV